MKAAEESFVREWVAQGGDVFKQSFTLGAFHHHQINAAPDCALTAGSHREIVGDGIGRLHLDTYASKTPPLRLFARLYHVATGQFRWYRVTQNPTPASESTESRP